ncbi:MFS transporter [Cellvibrio sp. ARAG 10.3]|uniref:MFS transporter n=1 Tax=Cellvibrio sp. ARAG 10.3 TaxID=3451358 RepID=UPI003F473E89
MQRYWQFVASSWPLLAFGFVSIFWGNLGQSFFISWYGASIQDSLSLSAGAYGTVYSSATLLSSLVIMAFGGMIDHWPLRRFATLAAIGLTAACVALGAANTLPMLFLGFFLVRLCGQGLFPHTAQTTMARYFDNHRGKALSISASGVPVGEIVLPLLAVALISAVGWRESWWVLALTIPLIYLPTMYWLLRRAPINEHEAPLSSASPHHHTSRGRREMLRDYRFWLALPTVVSGPFILTGVFIHQGFIITQKQWDPLWLASCFVVYGVVHWVSSMAAGVLVDRFTARRLLPMIVLPLAGAMFSLAWLDGSWVALLFMTLLGINIGISSPITGALWAEVYGTGKLGSIRSLMTSLGMIATSASPILFGLLIDNGIHAQALFGTAGLGIVLAGLVVWFSYPRLNDETLHEQH